MKIFMLMVYETNKMKILDKNTSIKIRKYSGYKKFLSFILGFLILFIFSLNVLSSALPQNNTQINHINVEIYPEIENKNFIFGQSIQNSSNNQCQQVLSESVFADLPRFKNSSQPKNSKIKLNGTLSSNILNNNHILECPSYFNNTAKNNIKYNRQELEENNSTINEKLIKDIEVEPYYSQITRKSFSSQVNPIKNNQNSTLGLQVSLKSFENNHSSSTALTNLKSTIPESFQFKKITKGLNADITISRDVTINENFKSLDNSQKIEAMNKTKESNITSSDSIPSSQEIIKAFYEEKFKNAILSAVRPDLSNKFSKNHQKSSNISNQGNTTRPVAVMQKPIHSASRHFFRAFHIEKLRRNILLHTRPEIFGNFSTANFKKQQNFNVTLNQIILESSNSGYIDSKPLNNSQTVFNTTSTSNSNIQIFDQNDYEIKKTNYIQSLNDSIRHDFIQSNYFNIFRLSETELVLSTPASFKLAMNLNISNYTTQNKIKLSRISRISNTEQFYLNASDIYETRLVPNFPKFKILTETLEIQHKNPESSEEFFYLDKNMYCGEISVHSINYLNDVQYFLTKLYYILNFKPWRKTDSIDKIPEDFTVLFEKFCFLQRYLLSLLTLHLIAYDTAIENSDQTYPNRIYAKQRAYEHKIMLEEITKALFFKKSEKEIQVLSTEFSLKIIHDKIKEILKIINNPTHNQVINLKPLLLKIYFQSAKTSLIHAVNIIDYTKTYAYERDDKISFKFVPALFFFKSEIINFDMFQKITSILHAAQFYTNKNWKRDYLHLPRFKKGTLPTLTISVQNLFATNNVEIQDKYIVAIDENGMMGILAAQYLNK